MRYADPLLALSFLCVALLTGCGWEQKFRSRAEGRDAEVVIQQRLPANSWGTRILVNAAGHRNSIYQYRGDSFLQFIDIAWTENREVFTVVTCGTPYIKMAYNIRRGGSIPFEPLEAVAIAHIRTAYHLEPTMSSAEVMAWACSWDGTHAFLKRHPEARER